MKLIEANMIASILFHALSLGASEGLYKLKVQGQVHLMRKFLGAILVTLFVVNTLGASANNEAKSSLTKITLDTQNPNVLTAKARASEKINLTLNKNSAKLLKAKKQKNIKITPGESNVQKAIRLASEKKRSARRIASAAVQPAPSVIGVPFNGNFDDLYRAAGKQFGIPWQILAAVHSVESGQSGDTARGSYAGAVGPMQFLPSTFRAYAVDGNGDGIASIYSVVDSVYSAANYLSANKRTKGSIAGALWQYNHSGAYIAKVLGIARGWGYSG